MASSLVSWERGFERFDLEDECAQDDRTLVEYASTFGGCAIIPCREVTPSPVRLRMQCKDMLCRRCMQVAWTDLDGTHEQWSSWTDPFCGWFEAEKLLPSTAQDIFVSFQVQTVATTIDICAVDRSNDSEWVRDPSTGECPIEIIRLRHGNLDCIDACFELAGPALHCHVWRAWNASRSQETPPEAWEQWNDVASRPESEGRPDVLDAADKEAPRLLATEVTEPPVDPLLRCSACTQRLVASAIALQEVRVQTIRHLRMLDCQLSGQWVAVNSVTSVSAGLGVAAAAALFVCPAVAVGLCVGSAVVGGTAVSSDAVCDYLRYSDFRRMMSRAAWNGFAVTELEKEWEWSRKQVTARISPLPTEALVVQEHVGDLRTVASYSGNIGATVTTMVGAGAEARRLASAPSAPVAAGAVSSQGYRLLAPLFGRTLGVLGAAVSLGIAIHGWSSTKANQALVRSTLVEIRLALALTQRWLASMSVLQCAICGCSLNLSHEAACCQDAQHCFHEQCLHLWTDKWESGDVDVSQEEAYADAADSACGIPQFSSANACPCPVCGVPLAEERCSLEELLSLIPRGA